MIYYMPIFAYMPYMPYIHIWKGGVTPVVYLNISEMLYLPV